MIEHLASYLAMPFVWRALCASALIACAAALLGVTLVLRRLSFMGDGLSHVAFGALAVSAALGLSGNGMLLALPVTGLAAVILLRSSSRFKGDASLAMLSVSAMAIGYLLMHAFPSSSNVSGDVCSTLFGSISLLTLTGTETWLSIILSLAVCAFSAFTFHKNFAIAFDEDFARATGGKTAGFNLVSAVVTAVVIVISMKLVGALLVSALVVFPVVIAMKMSKSFLGVTICSAVLATVLAIAGTIMAITALSPVGATIVAVNAAAFLAFSLFKPRYAIAVLLAALAAFFAFSAIKMNGPAHSRHAHDNKNRIVVTMAPYADWTRNILGGMTNAFDIISLQREGTDMHSFIPSADDIREIASCGLFVSTGGESEAWVRDVIAANPDPHRAVLFLMDALPRRVLPEAAACEHCHQHEHWHDGRQHAADEHIWLSLRDASLCVKAIAEAIGGMHPDLKPQISRNVRDYDAALHALEKEFAKALENSNASEPFLFADRFPFSRLADDYNLKYIAAFKGCSSDAEVSFETIHRLAHEIDEHAIERVFVLENSDRRLAESIIAATTSKNARIIEVDSMQNSLRATYLETMRSTLKALTETKRREN